MKKNTAGKNFITALIIIGVFCFAGWIASMFDSGPRCIETGCYRRQEPDSDYCYDHELYREEPLQMTNHHPMTNRQRTVPMIVAHPKKHIIISTTIVTVILIHLTAIIQEKIHMEHLVPPTISTYDSYDEGYDDIYMDGDYDDNRYDNDSDYADGVDECNG